MGREGVSMKSNSYEWLGTCGEWHEDRLIEHGTKDYGTCEQKDARAIRALETGRKKIFLKNDF